MKGATHRNPVLIIILLAYSPATIARLILHDDIIACSTRQTRAFLHNRSLTLRSTYSYAKSAAVHARQ